MASQTIHVVQSFDVNEFGEYGAEAPKSHRSAAEAGAAAEKAYTLGKPSIAFSRTGDPAIGEYSEPVVIKQAGPIPDEILDAFCGEGI